MGSNDAPTANHAPTSNHAMVEYWNGAAGARWAVAQDRYDLMLDPVSAPMFEALDPRPGDLVLDVGCGAGSITLEVARRLEEEGLVTGLDVSRQLLGLAAARVEAEGLEAVVELVDGDAQVHPFPPGTIDAVTSRFGVMFFADPTAAFANLARASAPNGRLAMTIWQPRAANEWMEEPMAIAGRTVPEKEADPTAPGPWSLGDADRTRRILSDAGWRDVELTSSTGELLVGGPGTLEDSIGFVVERGTVSSLLGDAGPEIVEAVRSSLAEELAPRHDGTGLRLGYAAWILTATR